MNILVLASEYPYEKDTNADRTKVVGYFAREWVKQGHKVIAIVDSSTFVIFFFFKEDNGLRLKFSKNDSKYLLMHNFVAEHPEIISFFGNAKRYSSLKEKRNGRKVIISSNVKSDTDQDIVVNYHSFINRGYKYFENSTIMLLNLLKRVNPRKVTIAGFDGFSENVDKNYVDASY